MKAIVLIIVLAILAYSLWPRSNNADVQETSETGKINDLPKYFNLLQGTTSPYRTLIIAVDGSDEFIQFASGGNNIEIDFPLVTENQKSFESRFRMACENQNLEIREVVGSDDTLFLDADLPQGTEERSEIVKNILADVFDVTESEILEFTYF